MAIYTNYLTPSLNNHFIIINLLILLVLYILFFAIEMAGAWFPGNNAIICIIVINTLRVFSIILFVLGVFLFINWLRMKSQLVKFKENIGTFNLLYKTVSKAIIPLN
jgi:hypothetical protein